MSPDRKLFPLTNRRRSSSEGLCPSGLVHFDFPFWLKQEFHRGLPDARVSGRMDLAGANGVAVREVELFCDRLMVRHIPPPAHGLTEARLSHSMGFKTCQTY